jgi:hypothetical protein
MLERVPHDRALVLKEAHRAKYAGRGNRAMNMAEYTRLMLTGINVSR